MKENEVPQDQAPGLGGERKALYARDASGRYTTVASSGWDAEEIVLQQALDEYSRACAAARARVERGESAALEYHMYSRRMDITLLAQSTGFFKWQVRRHLRPQVFSSLSARKLQRYEQALQLSATELASLPPPPTPDSPQS